MRNKKNVMREMYFATLIFLINVIHAATKLLISDITYALVRT